MGHHPRTCFQFILHTAAKVIILESKSEVEKGNKTANKASYLCGLLKLNLPKKLWKLAPWSYPTKKRVRELWCLYTASSSWGAASGFPVHLLTSMRAVPPCKASEKAPKRCRYRQLEISWRIFKWSEPVDMGRVFKPILFFLQSLGKAFLLNFI